MQWKDREESENVEDQRGMGRKAGLAVGGAGGIIVVILALIFGVDPQKLGMGGPDAGGQPDGPAAPPDPAQEEQAKFSKVIFHDTEEVWDEQFRKMNPPKKYIKPTLVLFSGEVRSACGTADSAVGPFYCPGDSKVYIDLDFYKDMQKKLHAPGEFARAYVIAHEVGHHVQRLLGYSAKVDEARRTQGKVEQNRMSVRLELQADFLAGVWAHWAQEKYKFLDEGDLKSAINAANQIGDDRLQKQATGRVVPDAFTHGTSEQRMRWFNEGFRTGDVKEASRLFDLDYNKL